MDASVENKVNPDSDKQIRGFIFNCKFREGSHAPLSFTNSNVCQISSHKRFEINFDLRSIF